MLPTSPDTTASNPLRELAAIMFSDIAGYTAIMGRDEESAMRALDEHRALLRSLLPKFNGRMIGEIGDGTLTSFHSALDAVNCAREVQASLKITDEFQLRIGIHVGDVLFSNNDVHGDGVNVASRIHALAAPGAICISERVYDDIRNKPGMRARDLGEKRLKNVNRPIRVYALSTTALDELPRTEIPRWTSRALAAAVVILLIAVLGYGVAKWRSSAPSTSPQLATQPRVIRSIAVLPLDNFSGDPNQEYFSDGMTDELTTDLASVSALRVISRGSVMQYKGAHRPPTPEIAKALNVDAVVEGSVMRVGDKVRITAQLIDARDDKHLWSKNYERDTRDVLAMQDEVAMAIANQINIELTPQEQQQLSASNPVNPAAYEAYLKGRYYYWLWTGEGSSKALQYFQESVDLDPTFALGYLALADWYMSVVDFTLPDVEGFSKGKQYLRKALQLNPSLAEAHKSLAAIKYEFEYDWAGSESEFRRAIALRPNYADAYFEYGYLLFNQGRFAESLPEFEKARQIDPLNPIFTSSQARPLNYLGQSEKALGYCQQAAALNPDAWTTHSCFIETYSFMGRSAEALAESEKYVGSTELSQFVSPLAVAYLKSGNSAQTRTMLDRLNQASAQPPSGVYISPCGPAVIYAALDDLPKAFDHFEQCYQERSQMIVRIKTDPNLAKLHADPRFIELLKKINLDSPADDYTAQGFEAANQGTAEGNARARKLFQAAIDLDPQHASAVAGLGYTFWIAWNTQWDSDPASLDKAVELGRNAVAINELPSQQDYAGQYWIARMLLALTYTSKGQYEQAVDEAKRATAPFPGDPQPYIVLAAVLNFSGSPADAIEQLKRATQLDARDLHLEFLGWSYALLGRYDDSIAAEKEYVVHNPDLLLAHLVLAFDYAQIHKLDKARAEANEILHISPKYTTAGMRRQSPYKDASETERWISALRSAGVS